MERISDEKLQTYLAKGFFCAPEAVMPKPYFDNGIARLYEGNAGDLSEIPDASVHCVVTSPPYWGLRDYGLGDDGIGLERTPELYVERLVDVFREVWRVLRDDGTLWLNLGDSYASNWPSPNRRNVIGNSESAGKRNARPPHMGPGLKDKDLVGIPWRVAFALQADGWWLRSDIVWSKPNPMPEPVTDRPTKSHEYLFLLSKSAKYYYDHEAIKEPQIYDGRFTERQTFDGKWDGAAFKVTPEGGRNRRDVWTIATQPFTDWTLRNDHQGHEGQGAASGGKKRITSPNCPAHGDSSAPGPSGGGDGHGVGPESNRERIAHRRASGQIAGSGPIRPPGEPRNGSDNLGLPLLEYGDSAKERSKEIRKKDPAPETIQPCTPSDKTGGHTDGKGDARPYADPDGSNDESNTLAASRDEGDQETEWSRLRRCKCSYKDSTTEVSHFATFPEALVEPCILAGTPERGVCPECGAPWERMLERTPMVINRSYNHPAELRTRTSGMMTKAPESVTTGWQPTCAHGGDSVPATVLDPFAGSGTVAAVAQRLGRRSVGVDLNPEYLELAAKRIGSVSLPMALL